MILMGHDPAYAGKRVLVTGHTGFKGGWLSLWLQQMGAHVTGFALAAVANFLLHNQGQSRRVSPRMFYEMARRYDEWPGEWYEGSSARGAMKGWLRHGVAQRSVWGDTQTGTAHMTPAVVRDAMRCPGGAYYRVNHRQVRDMHAALAEVGILYVTLMVHDGWFEPGPGTTTIGYVDGGNTAAIWFGALPIKAWQSFHGKSTVSVLAACSLCARPPPLF